MHNHNLDNLVHSQREYYARTAAQYDTQHVAPDDEHQLALAVLAGILPFLDARSLLDVGSGTGRALHYLHARHPSIHIVGIEPVSELREVGYGKGIERSCLIDGDATKLAFPAEAFDVVCEFGVLHHVPRPDVVVAEMLRVAKKAVFLSDSNIWGQGRMMRRFLKTTLRALRLQRLFTILRTRGKGYFFSQEDGISFPYSVFDNYQQIKRQTHSIHILNTTPAGINPLYTASHVALLGLK